MQLKGIITLLLFVLSVNSVWSQTKIIGSVKTVEGQPLSGASIVLNQVKGTVSDESGQYQIDVDKESQSVVIQFRMLGYATIDTVITDLKDFAVVDVMMDAVVFDQPTIVIQADRFDAFDQESWRILDIEMYKGKLLVLYLKAGDRILEMFTPEGISMQRSIVTESCNSIFVSCMGGLHLVGEERCVEYAVMGNRLSPQKEYARLMYDKSMAPCMQKKSDHIVLRYWSEHNKKAKFVKYQDQELTVLHEIYDELSATTAQSYYREIIGKYNFFTNNPKEGAIDEGIPRENIIVDGSWSGDLLELAINNDLHFMIAYYLGVEARPLDIEEIVWKDRLYIFDVVNEKVLRLGEEEKSTKEYNVPNWDWDKKFELIIDNVVDQLYLFKNKRELYAVDFKDGICQLSMVDQLQLADRKAFGGALHDGWFYYYTLDIIEGMKSQVHRVKLTVE